MEGDIKPRITDAKRLVDEIARIGSLDRQRAAGQSSAENTDDVLELGAEMHPEAAGSLPVSLPDMLSGKIRKVIVDDEASKSDLVYRLQEMRFNLLDLSERQLGDLIDEAPSGSQIDIELVDKLLAEMRSVRRCMETVVNLERALRDS